MKLRKQIKQHARKILKQNLPLLIITTFIIVAIIISLNMVGVLVSVVFDIKSIINPPLTDGDISDFSISIKSVLFTSICVLINFVIITPLLYGVALLLVRLTEDKSCEIADIFFYFSSVRLFLKTLFSGVITGLGSLFYLCVLTAPANLMRVVKTAISMGAVPSSPILFLSDFLYMGLLVLGIIFYFAVSLRYLLVPFILARDEHISVKVAIKTSVRATRLIKPEICFFILSFLWALILSVLIIPAFYLLPYISISVTLYADFLLKQYAKVKNR